MNNIHFLFDLFIIDYSFVKIKYILFCKIHENNENIPSHLQNISFYYPTQLYIYTHIEKITPNDLENESS